MNSVTIAGIVFACTFGGALIGMYLRRRLPESHLNADSKDVVKMGTGLLATLAALVLGLLISSAKSSYDAQRAGIQQLSTNLILLDRSLKLYGPETQECRELLQHTIRLVLDQRGAGNAFKSAGLDSPEITESGMKLVSALQNLSSKTDSQKAIQSQALQVASDLARTRWTLMQGDEGTIPGPFLVVLIFWLTALFVVFGLFAPGNATVVSSLLICAISLAGALFLIVELDRPFHGMIQISSKPLSDALGQLGK